MGRECWSVPTRIGAVDQRTTEHIIGLDTLLSIRGSPNQAAEEQQSHCDQTYSPCQEVWLQRDSDQTRSFIESIDCCCNGIVIMRVPDPYQQGAEQNEDAAKCSAWALHLRRVRLQRPHIAYLSCGGSRSVEIAAGRVDRGTQFCLVVATPIVRSGTARGARG